MTLLDQPRTITAPGMRGINRSAVVELIRREGPISRNEIAGRLGVSLPTVMRIVDDLVKEDLVRPTGSSQWSGGRRRALLEFNSQGRAVVGIDLGGAKLFGAVADLGGKILDEAEVGRQDGDAEESFQLLVQLVNRLLHSPKIEGFPIVGIGIGVPGITQHQQGIVKWAYSLNWRDYPLKAKLAERFSLPIIVDNDVNLMALGELWFGAGQNRQDMVLIAIGSGLGAGIIINGELYRGAHEASGEVGHLILGREFLGKQFVDFGMLETLASGTGIARQGRRALEKARGAKKVKGVSAEEVFAAAREGRPWARKVLDETIDYLALAFANISVCLDPELIVLGGEITQSADLVIGPSLKRLEGMIPTLPQVVVSPLGRRAAVMGAIVNVLHNTEDFYLVRKLS